MQTGTTEDRLATHAPLRQIAEYWQTLRGTRVAPPRAEIDPHAIAAALDCALILERPAPNDDGTQPGVRIRLAGQHICALMGMEMRGMPLHALIDPPDRARFADRIAPVFDAARPVETALSSPRGEAPKLTARLILLPLTDARGAVTRALGGLHARGLIGAPPRRLALADGKHFRDRLFGSPDLAPRRAARGFQEPRADFEAEPHPDAPYLRLVKPDND